MSFFGSIITLLDARMTEPAMFGWFHLLFIALTILCAVFLCKKFKNPSQKTVSKILLSFALISIFLEIYKQFNYTLSYDSRLPVVCISVSVLLYSNVCSSVGSNNKKRKNSQCVMRLSCYVFYLCRHLCFCISRTSFY